MTNLGAPGATYAALLFFHASALVLWIGSIVATAIVLAASGVDARARGAVALRVYRSLAVPGFVVAFVAGAALLLQAPRHYLVEHHWMHAKLLFVLAVIGLHHVIGAKARKAEAGTLADPSSAAKLGWITLACAVAAVACVTLGPLVM
jgi:putative membrane protein